eukprot:gi/632987506/ref/XP_007882596.1/ PREDICTED: double-strand-break repair protein rad21 homolog isoform X1 [Callorhinchus milii]
MKAALTRLSHFLFLLVIFLQPAAMFYASLFLTKRGPLAKIWLAAHWDKKLTKAHIFECNLEITVESIISPKVKLALRTSGHLLLGVVRIYHRKAKYLLADCNEALTKIKITFRPGIVDLSEENLEATYNDITLPEEFHDFSNQLPDVNAIDVAEHFTLNQSTAEEITLREDVHRVLKDNGFGGYGMMKNGGILDDNLTSTSESIFPQTPVKDPGYSTSEIVTLSSNKNSFQNDGFGDEGAADTLEKLLSGEAENMFMDFAEGIIKPLPNNNSVSNMTGNSEGLNFIHRVEHLPCDQTTLLSNEEKGFALQPVDTTVSSGKKRGKRRRNLTVDCVKELDSKTIREWISDFSDIITTIDLAPPTKRLMIWKESGGVEKLQSEPAQYLISCRLLKLFTRCLTKGLPREVNGQSEEFGRECEIEAMRSEPHNVIADLPIMEEPSHMHESTLIESDRSSIDHTSMLIRKRSNKKDKATEKGSPASEILTVHLTSVDLPLEVSHPPTGQKRIGEEMEDEPRRSHYEAHNYDERKWNKRTQLLLHNLQKIHQSTSAKCFSLLELCRNNNRKQAAVKFYSFLMLKKQSVLIFSQIKPYADIIAIPGPRFHL